MYFKAVIAFAITFGPATMPAADAEWPRFVEALDKCEDMWSAGKYDELYEYVGEFGRKAPTYLPARFLFAFSEGRFGLYENRVAELRRLTNQVCRVLCEVNPELLSRVAMMTADAESVAARFVALNRDRKNEDPRSMASKKDLSKFSLYPIDGGNGRSV